MALSAAVVHDMESFTEGPANIRAYPGVNANVFWAGAFVMLNSATGLINEAADTAAFGGIGIVRKTVTADGAAGDNEVQILTGPVILRKRAVVGASAVTDIGDFVYATADDTLTKSATANTKAVGEITRWYSSTTCDVMLYGWGEQRGLN